MACVLAAGAGVALVFQIPATPLVYSRTVSAFLRHPDRETRVRVRGYLVRGSLCKQPEPCEFRFRLRDALPDVPLSAAGVSAAPEKSEAQAQLPVRYASCTIPDTFGSDGCEPDPTITVEGELCETCDWFEASQVLAMCPGKYEVGARYRPQPTPIPVCPR